MFAASLFFGPAFFTGKCGLKLKVKVPFIHALRKQAQAHRVARALTKFVLLLCLNFNIMSVSMLPGSLASGVRVHSCCQVTR
jgi:hypothetical protein